LPVQCRRRPRSGCRVHRTHPGRDSASRRIIVIHRPGSSPGRSRRVRRSQSQWRDDNAGRCRAAKEARCPAQTKTPRPSAAPFGPLRPPDTRPGAKRRSELPCHLRGDDDRPDSGLNCESTGSSRTMHSGSSSAASNASRKSGGAASRWRGRLDAARLALTVHIDQGERRSRKAADVLS
jgi:hypothetical protein